MPRKLSAELAELHIRSKERALTLREVIIILGGRAFLLLILVLSLPFITPISLPGLSTPFGLAIALIALRLSLGQSPWLPERLLQKQVPLGFFGRLHTVTEKIIWFQENFSGRGGSC